MADHPYGWWSLMPPVAAIALAIATRRVILSLLVGVFAGALVTTQGDPWLALVDTLELHLWKTLVEEERLRVFSFTLLMGAMVGVINRGGGMRGLINVVSPLARTRRSGQLATWMLGLIIFFDDYANTMLLGNTLRPLCDKLKISREKLSYLVDSTAAPVAGLALVSTWIAVELAYVQDGINNLPTEQNFNAFELFIASIPYRFYVLMALCFVPLVALLGRDFGPMLWAERKRIQSDEVDQLHQSAGVHYPTEPAPDTPQRWFNAVLPIGVTLVLVVVIIYQSGYAALAADPAHTEFGLRAVFGAANSSIALQYGALAGLLVAVALSRMQHLMPPREILEAAVQGARVVIPAIMILWCASTISRMTGNKSVDGAPSTTAYQYENHRLYTGDYLKAVLTGTGTNADVGDAGPRKPRFSSQLLPTVVFLLSSVVAFCTGTSFGTMGILLPMVVPLAYTLIAADGQLADAHNPLLLCSIGSVLAGAVFGDHCSPISDTTVLSSQSSGCDHIAHVWTQMPYAVSVAIVNVLLGTIPLGWGISVWILLPIQFVVLVCILLLAGRRV